MEFEVLDENSPAGPLDALRRFLQAPRRQMQLWGDQVPLVAAACVFGLVVVEMVLSHRLANGLGRGPSAIPQALAVTLILVIAEFVVVGAASGIATLSGKSGDRHIAMANLSLGLSPLLLVLPATLLCQAVAVPDAVRVLIVVLLGLKVVGLWKAALEVSYKFNAIQSIASLYLAAGLSAIVGLLTFYAAALAKIASVLS